MPTDVNMALLSHEKQRKVETDELRLQKKPSVPERWLRAKTMCPKVTW
jgi:hypothetical protein